jgi:nucleoredoxin
MEKLRAAGKAVEAIFVSSDRNEESFTEYHSHMTWPALPLGDSRKRELSGCASHGRLCT